jgi:class 3 adenylate cyclase
MTLHAMFFGAFFGLISAVAIYHLLMYAILRAPEFLSYGAYLAALAIFQLGRDPQYIGVLGIGADASILFWWSFAALGFCGYWMFRSFLSLRALQPRLERVFFALTCVMSAAAVFAPWFSRGLVSALKVLTLVVLVVAAGAIVVAVRGRVRVATYFGVAYAGFFIGALLGLLASIAGDRLGALQPVFALGVEIGVAFQALTLALGLADRIAAANEERDRAQRHTIEQISSLNVAYARFVPSAFLDLLGKSDVRDVQLGDGIEREMTVLFSDVRSFTTISESLSPNETFGFINTLLSRMGPVIREYGGIVDKYVGDAIMALFPGAVDDALRAAIALQRAVAELNVERAAGGLGPIAVGVGLHRGSLMLGTIGESERMDGTVIADAVNIASRVEGLTKYYGARVMITGDVRAALRDADAYVMRSLGKVAVMGTLRGIDVWEVLDGDAPARRAAKLASHAAFTAAMNAFSAGMFADAIAGFDGVLRADADDGAARYLHGRARDLAMADTPWDGFDRAAK